MIFSRSSQAERHHVTQSYQYKQYDLDEWKVGMKWDAYLGSDYGEAHATAQRIQLTVNDVSEQPTENSNRFFLIPSAHSLIAEIKWKKTK